MAQDIASSVEQPSKSQVLPSSNPLEWTQADVVTWLATLTAPPSNLARTYGSLFTENDIEGEALIHLDPDSLKEIGVGSVGHRLVILRAIYDIKVKWGIEVDEEDWRPDDSHQRSASTSYAAQQRQQLQQGGSMGHVQAEHMLRALKERDERVRALEIEVARLEDWLVRYAAAAGGSPRVSVVRPVSLSKRGRWESSSESRSFSRNRV